jgi:hypothetical protein
LFLPEIELDEHQPLLVLGFILLVDFGGVSYRIDSLNGAIWALEPNVLCETDPGCCTRSPCLGECASSIGGHSAIHRGRLEIISLHAHFDPMLRSHRGPTPSIFSNPWIARRNS